MADYQAQYDAAVQARDLLIEASRLVATSDDLLSQLDQVEEQMRRARMPNADQILEQTGSAKGQLEDLLNKLRRPQPAMNYRVYPRLVEEIRTTLGGLTGGQARPTQGLLTVLQELEGDAAARARELSTIIDGSISTLNRMLGDMPKVITPGRGGR
jgi:ABC-type transporter Mla subunit MlaD